MQLSQLFECKDRIRNQQQDDGTFKKIDNNNLSIMWRKEERMIQNKNRLLSLFLLALFIVRFRSEKTGDLC